MPIYTLSGDEMQSAYGVDGERLTSAFAKSGEKVFPDRNTVKVMSYNVGSWTWFGRNATSANQEKYYVLQNAIFAEELPDLVGIQEYYSGIGSYSVQTMIQQYLPYFYAVDKRSNPTKAGRALASVFPLINPAEVNFQTQEGEERSYLIADVVINGKNVKFLTAHLALTSAAIQAQIQELLQAVSGFESWILTGDFNVRFESAESDGFATLVKPFLDAGYHVANGSTFGFIPTFSSKAYGDDSDWRTIDNIMCSADIDIVDVYTNNEKMTNPTGDPIDHVPLIAELSISGE